VLIEARPAWHTDAACRGLGTTGFVVAFTDKRRPWRLELCAGCQVRTECAMTALVLLEGRQRVFGVWGGVPVDITRGRQRAVQQLRAVVQVRR
jgi:hypothetical protein